jgi:hypothetical protein
MKTGTHNLGGNAFADTTLVTVSSGSVLIRQAGKGRQHQITLSANQIALLKELLA